MTATRVGYARCSTDHQDLAVQQARLQEIGVAPERIYMNWLRVLGTTETPHIDQGVRHQLHPIMALLDVLEPEQ